MYKQHNIFKPIFHKKVLQPPTTPTPTHPPTPPHKKIIHVILQPHLAPASVLHRYDIAPVPASIPSVLHPNNIPPPLLFPCRFHLSQTNLLKK